MSACAVCDRELGVEEGYVQLAPGKRIMLYCERKQCMRFARVWSKLWERAGLLP